MSPNTRLRRHPCQAGLLARFAAALLLGVAASAPAQEADLHVAIIEGSAFADGELSVGESDVATIFVSNFAGPSVARGVTAVISLPACVQPGDVQVEGCAAVSTIGLICGIGTLAAEATAELAVTADTGGCAGTETFELSVAVGSNQHDPEPSNNTDTLTFPVGTLVPQVSELNLRVSQSGGSIAAGESLTLTANVENLGPQRADDLTLEFDVPLSMRFVSADAPDPTGVDERRPLECISRRGATLCQLSPLDDGEQVDIVATLTAVAPGEARTTVRVVATRVAESQAGRREAVASLDVSGSAIAEDIDGDGCVSTRDLARLMLAMRRGQYVESLDFNGNASLDGGDVARLRAALSRGLGCV